MILNQPKSQVDSTKPWSGLRDRIVQLALSTLPRMLVSKDGPFCFELTREDRTPGFDRDKSWRYTIMCLLGLCRAQQSGCQTGLDVEGLFNRTLAASTLLGVGDLGLLLWLAARIGGTEQGELAATIDRRLEGVSLDALSGMELAWLLVGRTRLGRIL